MGIIADMLWLLALAGLLPRQQLVNATCDLAFPDVESKDFPSQHASSMAQVPLPHYCRGRCLWYHAMQRS